MSQAFLSEGKTACHNEKSSEIIRKHKLITGGFVLTLRAGLFEHEAFGGEIKRAGKHSRSFVRVYFRLLFSGD